MIVLYLKLSRTIDNNNTEFFTLIYTLPLKSLGSVRFLMFLNAAFI